MDGQEDVMGIIVETPEDPASYENIVETDAGYYPPRKNDAEFIAHAPEDIKYLLERIEKLEKDALDTRSDER